VDAFGAVNVHQHVDQAREHRLGGAGRGEQQGGEVVTQRTAGAQAAAVVFAFSAAAVTVQIGRCA
jgi:hypothetical protein